MRISQLDLFRAPLWIAIVSGLVPAGARGGDLGAGQSRTVLAGDAPESWTLHDGATLTLAPQSRTLDIAAYASAVRADRATVEATNIALLFGNGAMGTIKGARIVSTGDRGLSTNNNAMRAGSELLSSIDVDDSTIIGSSYGASVSSAATLTLRGTQVQGVGAAGVGVVVFNGNALIQAGSDIKGQVSGVRVRQDERGQGGLPSGRRVTIDGARVEGLTGSGISMDTLRNGTTDGFVTIANGSEIIGGNGVAIDLAARTKADVTVDASALRGDVRAADDASAVVRLTGGTVLDGAVSGDIDLAVGSRATWNLAADSSVSVLDLSGGNIAFAPDATGMHRRLEVRGNLAGSGGVVALNVELNAGGALASQATDRLLVEGDVTTSGPTTLVVTPTGTGALTDSNRDGVVDAGEGMSLVQVAGASRADAFALKGGYVAAGPFQYTLHAFGPGQTDPAQKVLTSGPLNWDYRLGNRYVCERDCGPVDPPVDPPIDPPVDPGNPVDPGHPGDPGTPVDPGHPVDPGTPVDPGSPDEPDVPPPPTERLAVVPQVPSYLSAPAALLSYGDLLNDGLHQRLGDIREGAGSGAMGGEVFARYLGGQARYSANLPFQRYGYDFDQQVNALQLGGSLIALDGDNGTLRAGWAADQGTTRVTPHAVDGNSSARYRANGVAGWITWQHGDGFWVDGVVGATRYRGDVGTDLRGADVGRLRAHGWTMSVEAGLPIALGGDWTVEPRFRLQQQQLTFRDFRDSDGLDVHMGTARQGSATLGGRLARIAQPLFMPYASLDLTHTRNGDPGVDVSSDAWGIAERFRSGRAGNAYRVAVGAISQLSDHVQLYGEGNYQHFVGGYGMRGWAGNLGIRVSF